MRRWSVCEAQGRSPRVAGRAGVAVLTLLFAVSALAGDISADVDDGVVAEFVGKNWVNGRSWDLLDYSGRLGFVCGLFDGVTLFYSAAEARKKMRRGSLVAVYDSLAVPASLTVGDVVKGMDEFYQDSANTPLPAICAYLHFVYKSRGDSWESINEHVMKWRKMFPPRPTTEFEPR